MGACGSKQAAAAAPDAAPAAAPAVDTTSSDHGNKNNSKFLLAESKIPTHWYNIQADLPSPAPPVLHPGTKEPIGPDDLAPLFPMDLILQEVSQDRYIEIPEEVREVYKLWRPSPLIRARQLEKALGVDCKIFYK